MRRIRWAAVTAAVTLLAGCGVTPTGVTSAGQAPTGVAPGVTLYFVDSDERLQPQARPTTRLGTISYALSLLLSGPGVSDLHTEITPTTTTIVSVTTAPDVIELRVPLALREVTQLGIGQIVCTALGVYVQSGGSRTTTVRITFTEGAPGADRARTCPLISPTG